MGAGGGHADRGGPGADAVSRPGRARAGRVGRGTWRASGPSPSSRPPPEQAEQAEQAQQELAREARRLERAQARQAHQQARERYEGLTKAELSNLLAKRGLPKTGNVNELIERLVEADTTR